MAAITQTSLLGNFLGDFVKGNHYGGLPEDIQKGVWLHRKVDSFTDSHEAVKGLKHIFPKNIRRMSGVCIDIWFDHLLLQQEGFGDIAADEELFAAFYQELAVFDISSSGGVLFNERHFNRVKTGLLAHRWLSNYRESATCLKVFASVEARLNHKIMFAQPAFDFIADNQQHFEQVFRDFYPQLMSYANLLVDEDTSF